MAKFEIRDDTQGPWLLDLDTLMLDEGIELQRLTGFGPRPWLQALGEDDPKAVRFAFYLSRKRAGETSLAYKDVNVNLFAMELVQVDADDEDDGDGVSPDPGVTEDNADVVPTGLPAEPSDGEQTST